MSSFSSDPTPDSDRWRTTVGVPLVLAVTASVGAATAGVPFDVAVVGTVGGLAFALVATADGAT